MAGILRHHEQRSNGFRTASIHHRTLPDLRCRRHKTESAAHARPQWMRGMLHRQGTHRLCRRAHGDSALPHCRWSNGNHPKSVSDIVENSAINRRTASHSIEGCFVTAGDLVNSWFAAEPVPFEVGFTPTAESTKPIGASRICITWIRFTFIDIRTRRTAPRDNSGFITVGPLRTIKAASIFNELVTRTSTSATVRRSITVFNTIRTPATTQTRLYLIGVVRA